MWNRIDPKLYAADIFYIILNLHLIEKDKTQTERFHIMFFASTSESGPRSRGGFAIRLYRIPEHSTETEPSRPSPG